MLSFQIWLLVLESRTMTQERKGSVVMQGTLRDILTVIEKKIRNLEKRKVWNFLFLIIFLLYVAII